VANNLVKKDLADVRKRLRKAEDRLGRIEAALSATIRGIEQLFKEIDNGNSNQDPEGTVGGSVQPAEAGADESDSGHE